MDARLEQLLEPRYDRVRRHGPERANEEILRKARERMARDASRPLDEVEERLRELDREWDLERSLQVNAAAWSLVGLVLGATGDRRWLVVPGVVAGLLLQYGLTGWCPPVSVLRLLGCRTRGEVEAEKLALRVRRGDFKGLDEGHSASSEGPGWG
ncbi:YgaP family membrane protein [Archangium lipolyticum]|uniref:YgaP family membrane protein n=1 Tax=Archangium lipolyticum TaxID=2970465 RepID=UPI00214C0FFC|nr:DUF2892 domain-containing protein [Archangium lipolyticum]